MKLKFFPLLFALNFLALLALAQTNTRDHHRPHPAMQAEIKAYVQANIIPVMQQQRLKLEKELSRADQKKIRELRLRQVTSRRQEQKFRADLRAQRQAGTRQPTAAQRTQMQQLRTENQQIRSEAQVLVQKYQAQIKALYQEVATPAQTWRREIAAIVQKYQPANKTDNGAGPDHPRANRTDRHRFFGEYFRPTTFLLWNINKPLSADADAPAPASRIFPNPVIAQATLQYTVKEAGQVTIELLDENGKLIRNLYNANREPGEYSLEVNFSQLKSGLYFYQINTKGSTVTERFLKK